MIDTLRLTTFVDALVVVATSYRKRHGNPYSFRRDLHRKPQMKVFQSCFRVEGARAEGLGVEAKA